jgi:2-methylcitrate dehydratase PrpD
MITLTGRLVECIADIEYRRLPDAAIEMAKQVVLDGIGVIMAGYHEPLGLGRIVVDYTRMIGGAPQATVVGGGFLTSMPNAAFANGTMAHALDFDNTWYPLNHPTSPTLPVILALGEYFGFSGETLIAALVTAFEVQGRLRLAATGLETGKGFHKPGTTGTFGATAAAIKALRLDARQAAMALGIAGSRAGSMSLNTGSMTKSSHSGHAARVGLESALLAQQGFTAHEDIFGPGGFFDTFLNGNAEPERLIEGFARPLRMLDPGVGFKKYPSNYFTHRGIDAALALRARQGFDPTKIDRVCVQFPRFDYVDRPKPASGLDGKFSIQYTVAAALLDGEVNIDSFDNERRFRPDMERLLPRVGLHFDDAIPRDFDRMHVTVTVIMADGSEHSETVQRLSGWCGIPLTREQRMQKFLGCSRRLLSSESAHGMTERIEHLETLPDIRTIMAPLRAA